jgi:hypothetical protein
MVSLKKRTEKNYGVLISNRETKQSFDICPQRDHFLNKTVVFSRVSMRSTMKGFGSSSLET